MLLAIFRMGWISQFLSKAVITGFLFGAAIEVVVGELPKLTGTSIEGSNTWQKLWSWLGTLPETAFITLAVGILSLLIILTLRFKAPKVPGALVLVVLGIAATAVFNLGDLGLALVGDVPRGLPSLVLPDLQFMLDNLQVIGLASIGLLLIGFSQSAGDAREFASRHHYRIDINQESMAQGIANAGSGVVQGIPVSTSLSASSLNDSAGAKTPVASLTTGALVILTLLVLAPLFSYLPKAVLAAVIIDAVVFGMINVKEMRRLWNVKRSDFWIAVAAIIGVLGAGVLAGVIIGIVLSLGWLVYVASDPDIPVLGHKPGSRLFRSLEKFPDDETYPGLLMVRFDSGLFFASADSLGDRLRELSLEADPQLDTVVIDFAGINFIDSQGSNKIREILEAAEVRGVELRLARVRINVQRTLRNDGVIGELGEDHIYSSLYESVADRIPATSTEQK